jgi:hypothetical protein
MELKYKYKYNTTIATTPTKAMQNRLSNQLKTKNKLVTEEYDFKKGISIKNIAFDCYLFCILTLLTVEIYSLHTSKSSELWLLHNSELF